MRICVWVVAVLGGALTQVPTSASAASLQVSPVLVEVVQPAAAGAITLRNTGSKPLNAQIRVFRWVQREGRDELVATSEVVASPPAAALQPNMDHTIRVVRVSKSKLEREESYRLLVDELPDGAPPGGSNVRFLFRYSIPVFFAGLQRRPHQVTWTVQARAGAVQVTGRNSGDRRLRVASLSIVGKSGQTVASREGLAGYVLGQSLASWTMATSGKGALAPGSTVVITAQGDDGPIRSEAVVQGRP